MKGHDYFRRKIQELETEAPIEKSDFYREYTEFIINKMNTLKTVDSEGKATDVTAFFANPERAIAKIKEDRNLVLPVVTVAIDDIGEDSDRRRTATNIEIESRWDAAKNRAIRVVSKVPKPINVSFTINVWAKYVEDMNQVIENILMMFNPSLNFKTSKSEITKAFIDRVSDTSVMSAGDREDRVVRKSITVTAEAYITYPKYQITSTGKLETLTVDFETAGIMAQTVDSFEEKGIPPEEIEIPDDGTLFTEYKDQTMIMSDGFTMLFNVMIPKNMPSQVPIVIGTPGTGQYRGSTAYTIEEDFMYTKELEDTTYHMPLHLLKNDYAVASYDVRGQSTPWAPGAGGGGLESSLFHEDNLIEDPANPGSMIPWTEFGSESMAVRELLDVFEFKDYVTDSARPWAADIDPTKVGHTGGSLGGMTGSAAAAYSGKTVPITAIEYSQDGFADKGAASYGFNTDWGYTAGDTFSTFQAVTMESFVANFDLFELGDPPTRFAFLTGPIRLFDLTTMAPRQLDDIEAGMRNDSLRDFRLAATARVPYHTEYTTATVPLHCVFSYDDRQRSIDMILGVLDTYGGPNHLIATTGNHKSPKVHNAMVKNVDSSINWFEKYLKGKNVTVPTVYEYMITPSDPVDYKDLNHQRMFTSIAPEPGGNLHTDTSSFVLEKPTTGDRELIAGDPTTITTTTATDDLDFDISTTAENLNLSSTSDFVDYVISKRGGSRVTGIDMLKNFYANVNEFTFLSEPLTEDLFLFGAVSATFNIDLDTSGHFSYDIIDVSSNPDNPLITSERVVTMGFQAFDDPFTSNTVTMAARFQSYIFEAGTQIGIKLKNHSFFEPPVGAEMKKEFTLAVCPYFTPSTITFNYDNAKCYFTLPVRRSPDTNPI